MRNNLLACLFLFFSLNAEGAPIYKWVDEQGATHYSAAPPPNQKAVTVKSTPPPASASDEEAAIEKTRRENALDMQMRRAAQQEARNREETLARNEAEARKQKCMKARQNLGILQAQRRIYKINEKGEKVYWDDAFHDAEIIRMQKEIELNCDAQ